MIDKLIEEGEQIDSEVSEGIVGKYFSSVKYEQWVTKSILYLEQYYPNSIVTDKAKERFKKLNENNNYTYYEFLLGALKATKEFEKEQADSLY